MICCMVVLPFDVLASPPDLAMPLLPLLLSGPGSAVAVTICQLLNLVLSAIGYTVAAGESLK